MSSFVVGLELFFVFFPFRGYSARLLCSEPFGQTHIRLHITSTALIDLSVALLSPPPLPCLFVAPDCFHHELYHFLDMSIIRRVRFPQHPANSSLPPARRNQVKDVRPVDIGGELLEEEHKLLEVSVVEAPSALLAQEESPKESRSMFDFLDQAEVGLQGLPSVLEDDDMHAVARGTGWSRYSRDRGWECFNADPGFCYGSGGDHAENRREVGRERVAAVGWL